MPTPPPLPSLIQSHPCLLTLQSHHTADHNDVSSLPFLHIRHHFLDHSDHSEEIGLKHFLHLFDGDALHWAHKADTCIIDWSGEGEKKTAEDLLCGAAWWRYILLTEDIHVSIFDAINTLLDRFITAHVQHSQKKGFPICIPSSFKQLVLAFQITHCCYDCKQNGKMWKRK